MVGAMTPGSASLEVRGIAPRMPRVCDSTITPPNDEPKADPAPAPVSARVEQTAADAFAPWRWRAVVPLGLLLLVIASFFPTLSAGLVYWDDVELVYGEFADIGLDAAGLRWMWITTLGGHFQPLTWLTCALDRVLWPDLNFGLHATSLIFHALTALAFYFLARHLLRLGLRLPPTARTETLCTAAGLAAALFALHPLRVESVAWVAERRDVVSGLFCVLCVWSYLKYAEADRRANSQSDFVTTPVARSSTRWAWYGVSLALCFLSLLAKASAIVLAPALLILDVYPLRRLGGESGWGFGQRRGVWLDKLPYLGLALWAGSKAVAAQQASGAWFSLSEYGPWSRLAQAWQGLAFYPVKTLLPLGLGPIYEIPPPNVLFGFRLWVSAAVVLLLVALGVACRRRWPAVPAALAVYVVTVAPVLGFTQSGPQLVADRYSYLPCLGFAVLAGAALYLWRRRHALAAQKQLAAQASSSPPANATARAGTLPAVVATLLIFVLVKATHRQTEYWERPDTLWLRAVQVSPESVIAQTKYGDALARLAQVNEAEERRDILEAAAYHYRKALKINHRDPHATYHLAQVSLQLGAQRVALAGFARALELAPQNTRVRLQLAELLVDLQLASDAAEILRAGARLEPAAPAVLDALADLLATHHDAAVRNGPEAVQWARRLVAVTGDQHAPALLTLATALAEAGDFDGAIATGTRALDLAEQAENDRLAAELRRRLELFGAEVPYHYDSTGD